MNGPFRRPKKFSAQKLFSALALILFLLAAGGARAQDRWLLIFENSAAMKKRMPATGLELQKLFAANMSGQLHGGDSMGVWTFDQTLHVGEFPLAPWEPERAVSICSNIITFLSKRSFKGDVNFNALQPVLNEVVAGSHRLTVLIFCEGQGDIIWTPYNDGINNTLRQNYPERKKNSQPFVILLRVQDGKYFGCSVNFPPGDLNFPTFPELPEEIKPALAATNFTGMTEKKNVPLDSSPLVIVGKNVGTNIADLPPLPPKTGTNPPAVAVPLLLTNTGAIITNASALTENSPTQLVATTKAPQPSESPAPVARAAKTGGDNLLAWIGGLAFVSALGLVIFLAAHARQPRGSLITDSLNAPRMPPPKK